MNGLSGLSGLSGLKGMGQPPMNLNIDPKAMESIKCTSCNGMLFKQAHVLKRIPKFMIGAPTDMPLAFPVWRCVSCNTVLIEFIPDGLLNIEEDENEGV